MEQRNKLRLYWSKKEKDIMLHFPVGSGTKSDAQYINSLFPPIVLEDLTKRGYDISTIKFEIEPQQGNTKFASQQ